jgi:hypothetical protein
LLSIEKTLLITFSYVISVQVTFVVSHRREAELFI